MLIYGLNLAIIGLLYFFIYHSRVSKNYFLRLSLSYLFIISSLRSWEIGSDYPRYVQIFHSIIIRGTSYVEKWYLLLNKFVALFTHHYVGLAIAVNVLIFVPLYYYIKKQVHPKYWPLCVFIFATNPYMFIQGTFNVLRQTCATGIVLIGMNVLFGKNHKIKHPTLFFYLFIFVGAQFHRATYILGIIPIVLSIKWKKVYWFLLIPVSVFVNLVGARMLMSFVITRLHFSSNYLFYEASMLNNPIYVLFVVIVILFLLSHYDSYSKMSTEEKKIVDLYLFTLCFLIMALPNDVIFRVYVMLAYCALPAVPIICESTRPGFSRIRIKNEEYYILRLYIFYYLSYYIGYITYLALNEKSAYIPFRFFFS